jgi:hypothetical protein
MNAFVGKCQFVSVCLILGVFAFAKAQSTTTPQAKEYIVSANDDRSTLLVMTDLLKSEHGIQTKFKNFQSRKGQLTGFEFEFIQADGSAITLKIESDKSIETQSIIINTETNQIIYAGPKSGFTPAKEVTVVTAAKKAEPQVTYVKVSEAGESKESVAGKLKANGAEVSVSNASKNSKAVDAAKKAQEEAAEKKKQELKVASQKAETEKALNKEAESKLKAANANAQEDAARKKQSLEELERIQAKKLEDQVEKSVINERYVFINSKAYNYKIAQGKTFVIDENGRTVLVLPAELSKQPFSGTIPLNRLGYQFSLKENVISLFNGAGEPVDINGKEL